MQRRADLYGPIVPQAPLVAEAPVPAAAPDIAQATPALEESASEPESQVADILPELSAVIEAPSRWRSRPPRFRSWSGSPEKAPDRFNAQAVEQLAQ